MRKQGICQERLCQQYSNCKSTFAIVILLAHTKCQVHVYRAQIDKFRCNQIYLRCIHVYAQDGDSSCNEQEEEERMNYDVDDRIYDEKNFELDAESHVSKYLYILLSVYKRSNSTVLFVCMKIMRSHSFYTAGASDWSSQSNACLAGQS